MSSNSTNQSRFTMSFLLSFQLVSTFVLIHGMVPRNTYTTRTTPATRIIEGPLTTTPAITITQLDATSTSTATARRTTTQEQQSRRRKRSRQSLYQETATKNNNNNKYKYKQHSEEDEDDDEAESLSFEVNSFQELQRSTGSEILDDQLQSQIDRASPTPNMFVENHITDASYLEKLAMSSVPEQLPQPAVDAFRNQQQPKQRRTNDSIEFSTSQRVTPEEEIELAKMIQRGVWLHKIKTDREADDGRSISRSEWAKLTDLESVTQLRREVAKYRRAKQLLVSANMGLVHTVVKKSYHDVRKRSGITYEELVQEGSLGLLRAAELFDPSRGIRFSTYATIWIKGTLSNSHALDGAIKLPAREKTKWNKIVKAHQELVKEKGGGGSESNPYDETMSTVSVEEIAHRLDMKVEDVIMFQQKMKKVKSVLSLDYEYQQQTRSGNDNSKGQLMEMDKSMQADSELAERTQMQADVIAAMVKNLSPREARLMRLRYGLTTDGQTRTIQECADAMGVSQARASQLAKACLLKLRKAAEADSLEEYLLTIA